MQDDRGVECSWPDKHFDRIAAGECVEPKAHRGVARDQLLGRVARIASLASLWRSCFYPMVDKYDCGEFYLFKTVILYLFATL